MTDEHNPYQPPTAELGNPHNPLRHTGERVAGPAIALIVVSSIALFMLLLGLLGSLMVLVTGSSGAFAQTEGISPEVVIFARIAWNIMMQIVNVVIIYGAVKMKKMENRSMALTACILAIIPCVGPCCVLGIPFGIWGLVVMNEEDVRMAFDRDPDYQSPS